MAGGRGERFWPLSRQARPKQLLPIISEKTMLEETIDRILPLVPLERVVVVTDRELREAILTRVPSLGPEHIIAEPYGKNTCLAVGLAAVELLARDPEAVMIVLSSDHLVKPAEQLLEILREGVRIAREGEYLVTIGINPTRPETGYGYIEIGSQFAAERGILSYQVAAFKEKPDRPTAQMYYQDRQHLWNSGMFIWSAKSILRSIGNCQPRLRASLDEYAGRRGGAERVPALENLYREADSVSIDVAILESAENVVVIKGDLKWDDVGSWLALQRIRKTGIDGNVRIGDVLTIDSFETTAVNDGEGIVVCFGVSDLVVVKTDNIVMVAHKSQMPQLKKLLGKLNDDERLQQYL
jgi:mannose-1-phosphate guanylyltransferase